jgi:hypothetical protein
MNNILKTRIDYLKQSKQVVIFQHNTRVKLCFSFIKIQKSTSQTSK